MGGPLKIDSIQNVIILRSDLHEKWDNYEFGCNPDVGYHARNVINLTEYLEI
jgi:HNH endonuclease